MLSICGPAYSLAVRKAAVQRAVNLYLVGIEVPDKAPYILDSVPGKVLLAQPAVAEVRGQIEVKGRWFQVIGGTVYELYSNGTSASRGSIFTTAGVVSLAYGLSQLVIVDGTSAGYVLDLGSNVLTAITDPGFYGSVRVRYLNGRFLFIRPDSQQFYWSAIDDATTFDPLDFASAESQPDNLISIEISHDEAWLFGPLSIEVWTGATSGDSAFVKNPSASIENGCVSPYAIVKADNTIYWIGRDQNGAAVVYRAQGYTPGRISNHAIEQALQQSPDLGQATAYSYQEAGLTFIAFNSTELTATWTYEVSTSQWHERCDVDPVSGAYVPDRALNHCFIYNKHYVGSANGKTYELSKTAYTVAGDPLVRERVTPHFVTPGRLRQFFRDFWLDCTTGEAGQSIAANVELSWSKDSGATYSVPKLRSIGLVGERFARLVWDGALGMARDRVWKVKFSGNAPFAIVDGGAESTPGRA